MVKIGNIEKLLATSEKTKNDNIKELSKEVEITWAESKDQDFEEITLDLSELNETSSKSKIKDTLKELPKNLKTFSEKIFLSFGSLSRVKPLPVAGELLYLSLVSDEKLEDIIEKENGKILSPEETRRKLESFGLFEGETGHTEPDQMDLPTIEFAADSKISQKTQSNKKIQQLIQDWVNNGANEKEILQYKTANSGSTDLKLGLGLVLIAGLHKSEDGYVEGYIEDVYDYDKQFSKSDEKDSLLKRIKNAGVTMLNNMGYDLQEEGELKNYRVLIPIKVKVA